MVGVSSRFRFFFFLGGPADDMEDIAEAKDIFYAIKWNYKVSRGAWINIIILGDVFNELWTPYRGQGKVNKDPSSSFKFSLTIKIDRIMAEEHPLENSWTFWCVVSIFHL